MKVFFSNDGSYGQSALNMPVLVNDKPVGFVCEVDEKYVTCYLWDRFIIKEQYIVNLTKPEQDIRSIGINI